MRQTRLDVPRHRSMRSTSDLLSSYGVNWTDTAHSTCHTWFPLTLSSRSSTSTRWTRCASCLITVHQSHLDQHSDDDLPACRPSFVDDERVHVPVQIDAHHWSLVNRLPRRCLSCRRKVVRSPLGASVGLVCSWCSSVYHQCCWQQISDAVDDERNKCDYGQLR